MKTIPVVFAAMAMLTSAWAAKDVDLSEFDGNYKGNGTILAFGSTYPLTAKVKFDVSRNGSTAKVTFSGAVTSGGDSLPWGTTLSLKKKRKMTTSNIVAISEGPLYSAAGKYKLPKNSKIEGSTTLVVEDAFVVQDVTMVVKPKGKKKKQLKVTLAVVVNGAPYYTYNLTVTGK